MDTWCPNKEPSFSYPVKAKEGEPGLTLAAMHERWPLVPVLPDVFPEGRVQTPGNEDEDAQEDQYPDPDAVPLIARGLGHEIHEGGEIGDGVVKLDRIHAARCHHRVVLEFVDLDARILGVISLHEVGIPHALQLPQGI